MQFRDTKEGKYFFLSNFYPCTINITIGDKDLVFKNAEAAFQAQKNNELAEHFCTLDGLHAKNLGTNLTVTTENWDTYRVFAMAMVLYRKFSDKKLLEKLKEIKEDIVEDNYWDDTFWGVCTNKKYNHEGKNILGKLLTNIKNNDNNLQELLQFAKSLIEE